MEIWKDIPDTGNRYQASNLGRIKSNDIYVIRSNGKPFTWKGRIMLTQINRLGYETVNISDGIATKRRTVHKLVALAFIANPENKREINHKDGVKANNLPSNLEWVTRSENMNHAVKNKLLINGKGEKNGFSKLKDNDVKVIKGMIKDGFSDRDISPLFLVLSSTIYKIRKGISWGHINLQ